MSNDSKLAAPISDVQGYGWFDKVPAHWSVLRLKRAVQIINEKRLVTASDRYIGLENIEPWTGRLVEGDEGASAEGVGSCFRAGDVLFGKLRPYLAKAHLACADGIGSTELVVLRGIRLWPKFLRHCLATPGFVDAVAASTYGAKMPRANWDNIGSLFVPVPPTDEQEGVVRFLDGETAKIDALIEKQEQLVELAEEKRRAVTARALTQGLRQGIPMRNSGVAWIGMIPEHWKVVRLRHVAVVQGGLALGRKTEDEIVEVPYLRVANVQDGYLDLTEVKTVMATRDELRRHALRPGDVLMNEGGDNDKLGRGAIWHGEFEPCIHQNHVFAVRPHGVEPEWLTMVTGSDYAKRFFESRAKQTTNLASISSSNLREVPVVMPPQGERAAILCFLARQYAALDALRAKAAEAVALLREHRAALITAAVTGQIDVRSTSTAIEKAA